MKNKRLVKLVQRHYTGMAIKASNKRREAKAALIYKHKVL